jgi:hypothetical protein
MRASQALLHSVKVLDYHHHQITKSSHSIKVLDVKSFVYCAFSTHSLACMRSLACVSSFAGRVWVSLHVFFCYSAATCFTWAKYMPPDREAAALPELGSLTSELQEHPNTMLGTLLCRSGAACDSAACVTCFKT